MVYSFPFFHVIVMVVDDGRHYTALRHPIQFFLFSIAIFQTVLVAGFRSYSNRFFSSSSFH